MVFSYKSFSAFTKSFAVSSSLDSRTEIRIKQSLNGFGCMSEKRRRHDTRVHSRVSNLMQSLTCISLSGNMDDSNRFAVLVSLAIVKTRFRVIKISKLSLNKIVS